MLPAEVTIVLILLLIVILLCVFIVSWKLSSLIVTPNVVDPRLCYEDEMIKGKLKKEEYENKLNREDFLFPTSRGYNLSCTFIPRDESIKDSNKPDKVIILVHGYTSCKFGSVKYLDIFRSLGFHCLIYDHRNHGDSGKAPTTMGYYEAYDLEELCGWVRDRFHNNVMIGTHGESMGAATVMLHVSLFPSLSFVIEDCGYSSLTEQLTHNMKQQYHLPKFPFLYIASLLSKLRGGIFFHQVEPKNNLKAAAAVPMLFLHGEADSFVPFSMVNDVYKNKPGVKTMNTYPGAGHAESFWSAQQQYTTDVTQFLMENNII